MSDRELHHVGIVVRSIAESLPFYRDTLGLTAGGTIDVPGQPVRVVFLEGASGRIELLEPTDATSGVARFLAERGRSTLHHVCFLVDDLRGTLDRLQASGVELIDRSPRPGAHGDIAFLHPSAAAGVLVELLDRASLRDGAR